MAWIETVPDGEGEAELAALYERSRDPENGKVDNIMSIHSLHPGGLATHFELYREVMTGTATLRKVDREMIALVVSAANDCHY
jgi:alkylhydroperoxidase family enzyme